MAGGKDGWIDGRVAERKDVGMDGIKKNEEESEKRTPALPGNYL